MKTTTLLIIVALCATVPAAAAPQPNLQPKPVPTIIDYAPVPPKFVPRTWGELIRWLQRR